MDLLFNSLLDVFIDVGVCVRGAGAPQPLEPELVTLSLLPRSQWQTLVHLDAIKVLLHACFPRLPSCHLSNPEPPPLPFPFPPWACAHPCCTAWGPLRVLLQHATLPCYHENLMESCRLLSRVI